MSASKSPNKDSKSRDFFRHSRGGGNLDNLITDNLDIWTTAIQSKSRTGRGSNKTYELYGIKKLRELILDLAVRGLLVPQDPNDEPASELLKRIAVEKAKLLKEGNIKKQKPLAEISEEEKPFELPKGWAWESLGNMFEIVYGKGLPKSKLTEEGFKVFGANGIIGRYTEYNYLEKQLLVSCRGAYSGKANISPPNCFITSNTLILKSNWKHLLLKFFYYAITSADKSKIVTGSAQPQVTTTNLRPFFLAIPPLNEQNRIVTKVDELMALCDQLEQQTDSSIKVHKLLVENLLNALTQAKDHKTFQQAWQRIAKNFDSLFTTEHSIDQLKQTILQLAVMGKLVPQNPNDEPASELLKKIAIEKEKLLIEGKIKKQKPLPEISEEEKPFELPEGWEFVRLQEITNLITDGKHGDCRNQDLSGYYFLSAKNIQNGKLTYENARQILPKDFEEVHRRTDLEPLDICMVNTGATVGKIAITTDNKFTRKTTFQKSVAVIKVTKPFINVFYLTNFLISETPNLLKKSGGSAINNLLLGDIKKKLFCLPPLNEQNRIVAKAVELMALCNQMKSQITGSKTIQTKIADTLTQL